MFKSSRSYLQETKCPWPHKCVMYRNVVLNISVAENTSHTEKKQLCHGSVTPGPTAPPTVEAPTWLPFAMPHQLQAPAGASLPFDEIDVDRRGVGVEGQNGPLPPLR